MDLIKRIINFVLYVISSILRKVPAIRDWFKREPERVLHNPTNNNLVSPADGTITDIKSIDGNKIRITIFIGLFDYHSQYYPISGRIVKHKYQPPRGKWGSLPAMFKEKDECNESFETVILEPESGTEVAVIQIAGVFANKILLSENNEIGNEVKQGDNLGFILLGSSCVVEFSKDQYTLTCYRGKKVRGKKDILAKK